MKNQTKNRKNVLLSIRILFLYYRNSAVLIRIFMGDTDVKSDDNITLIIFFDVVRN